MDVKTKLKIIDKVWKGYWRTCTVSGMYGFYKGVKSNTERQYVGYEKPYKWVKREDMLIVQKVGYGLVNAYMYFVMMPWTICTEVAKAEIELTNRDKYDEKYSIFYRQWTQLYDLPPRN